MATQRERGDASSSEARRATAKIEMHVCAIQPQGDVSEFSQLLDSGVIDPRQIVALIGKADGSGRAVDPCRKMTQRNLIATLAAARGCSWEEVGESVSLIVSSGCFGVVTPHVTIVSRTWVEQSAGQGADPRLLVGCAQSRRIGAESVGRMGHVHAVAEAVTRALADAGLVDLQDVHAVLVKGPALSPADIKALRRRGLVPVSEHLWGKRDNVMSYSNDASALGVAAALGEVALDDLSDEVVRRDWSLYSNVAITSSEVGRSGATVVVLGNSTASASELQVGHSSIRDALDVTGVVDALRSAGLEIDMWPTNVQQGAIVQMFGKFVIPSAPTLRGDRASLLEEPDASHTAKVIGGVLVGAVAGHARVFVSGGEWNSHQGPPGCSPVAAVVRRVPDGLA